MKRIIGQVGLWLLVPCILYGQGESFQNNGTLDYSTPQLKTLNGRFETGIHIGYASMENGTQSVKTSTFSDYNSTLSNGMNTGVYVGYNLTNRINVKVRYRYSTTRSSALYAIQTKGASLGASPLVYVEDHYKFHQMGTVASYRFNIYEGKLFISPGVGASLMSFRNDGQMVVDYTQKSKAASLDGYMGLEYFISNNLGMGLTYYASSEVNFKDGNVELSESGDSRLIKPDSKFSFSDVSFRVMVLF